MPGSDVQRLLVSLPLAVVLLAPDQTISSVNPAAEQLFGQSQRRLIGRPLGEVVHFIEDRVNARLSDPEAQLSARAAVVELAGQGRRRLDVTLAPLLDEPGWQVLTLHDIGGVHSLGDDATVGDETMLRAPAILAHEIKNPLAGIRGAAQLLGRKLDAKDRALTGLIADEVDRIAGLIDQMQTLSRRSTEPVAPCNLHVALRRARAVIEAAGNAPQIVEEFDPSLPPVLGNIDSLVQVTINLLANARDACAAAAQPLIVIRTRFASGLQFHHGESGEPVRLPIELRISDNGPGIDPAMREHVFEPFVTSKKSGQGLGLALVRRLMRDMNGRIAHDRDEVAGMTHFRAHLPMAAAPANIQEQAA